MQAERGTIFHISSTPWHFTWQYTQRISQQFFERGWRVIFVDPLPKRIPRLHEFRRVLARFRNDPVQAGMMGQPKPDGITLITPKALPDRRNLARWFNRHWFLPRIAGDILPQAKSRPHVALVSLPTHAALDLVARLKPDFLIYACFLNFPCDPLSPKDIGVTEREITQRADLVIVDGGIDNQERIAAYQPSGPVIAYSATVRYDLFEPARAPRVIEPPESPVCCYFGDLRSNLDSDILRRVSHKYRLRLIGTRLPSLRGFSPNAEILQAVPYPQLPELLSHVDILLMPYQRDDPFNRGVFPAKTYECLATGKPTIAMGVPSLAPLSGIVDLADDEDAFMALIEQAMWETLHPAAPESVARREARLKAAQDHDEQASFDRWFAEIDQALSLKGWPAETPRDALTNWP